MNKVWAVAWREFRHTVLTKAFLFGVVVAPLFFLVVVIGITLFLKPEAKPLVGKIAVISPNDSLLEPFESSLQPPASSAAPDLPSMTDEEAVEKVLEQATTSTPEAILPEKVDVDVVSATADQIDDIMAGKTRPRSVDETAKRPERPHSLHKLGILLVPDLLTKTPPFVDRVRSNSAAAKKGLKADDLILFVNDRMTDSCKTLKNELSLIDQIDSVQLIIQRGQELLEMELNLTDGT